MLGIVKREEKLSKRPREVSFYSMTDERIVLELEGGKNDW